MSHWERILTECTPEPSHCCQRIHRFLLTLGVLPKHDPHIKGLDAGVDPNYATCRRSVALKAISHSTESLGPSEMHLPPAHQGIVRNVSGFYVPKPCENGPLMVVDVNIMDDHYHGGHSYANLLCIIFSLWLTGCNLPIHQGNVL